MCLRLTIVGMKERKEPDNAGVVPVVPEFLKGRNHTNHLVRQIYYWTEMAAALTQFLASFSPPPFVHQEEYDGLQFRWSILVFRPACKLRWHFQVSWSLNIS